MASLLKEDRQGVDAMDISDFRQRILEAWTRGIGADLLAGCSLHLASVAKVEENTRFVFLLMMFFPFLVL